MKSLVFMLLNGLLFFTAAAQNVGIGITTPSEKLHVDSTIKVGKNQTLGTTGRKNLVKFGDDDFVTIGEEATDDKLYIRYGDLSFMRSANSIGSGFIGVNTEAPSAHLDINGSFRLRGNGAAAGRVLTSDINGIATWQAFSGVGWSLTGNGGTNPAVNFLGTTDNQPLMLRQNNIYAGQFNYGLRNYFIGNHSGVSTVAPHNIAIGDSALLDNVSGYANIAIGSGALQGGSKYHNNVAIGDSTLFWNGAYDDGGSIFYGTQNTAVGSQALYKNYRGYRNTAVGFQAGNNMQLGTRNTVVGAFAMHVSGSSEAYESVAIGLYSLDSTLRARNTAVGAFALQRNQAGEDNVAVGHSAMQGNKGGKANTAIGIFAMRYSAAGDSNVAVGYSALSGNGSGDNNTALGSRALALNGTGYSNVAVGVAALSRNDGYSNLVAIGDSALFLNGTYNDFSSANNGTRNTAVGSKALYTNSSGYGNTALGFEAGYANGLAWNNTLIGREAMRHGGGSGAEGNVAVGVFALDSNQNFHNTSVGAYSMRRNRAGINNTAVGYGALDGNIAGSFNTAIGYGAGVSNATAISNATAVGAGAYVTQSNSVVLGSSNTNTGIGTTAPGHALDIQTNSAFGGKAQLRLHETDNDYARLKFTNTAASSYWDVAAYPYTTTAGSLFNFYFSGYGDVLSLKGDGNATLAGTLTQLSDVRLKRNIVPLSSSLKKLMQLNGYQYQWKDEARDQSLQIGVLAQEVEKLFPQLVKKDDNGTLSVNYSGLVPVLINAVKEQQTIIDHLEKRLSALEQKMK